MDPLFDRGTYQKIKQHILDTVEDLMTDPQWAHHFSDTDRVRIREDLLAFDRLPARALFENRIAVALHDLRICGEAHSRLTDHWFRRERLLPGEPGYAFSH